MFLLLELLTPQGHLEQWKAKQRKEIRTDGVWLDLDAFLDVGHFGFVALPLGDDFCIAQGVDEGRTSQTGGSCRMVLNTSGEVLHKIYKERCQILLIQEPTLLMVASIEKKQVLISPYQQPST